MEKKATISASMVQEFVGNAHGDLERIQQLLTEEPGLLNAAWDWGGGDWETALGAAAHMGRKDIANFLLEKGARMDIFAAAMLGKLELVKAIINSYPHFQYATGPHGISLVSHAEAGGIEAVSVLDYLKK